MKNFRLWKSLHVKLENFACQPLMIILQMIIKGCLSLAYIPICFDVYECGHALAAKMAL
jgi:hypothetical protein